MGKDSVSYAENGKGPVATFTAEDPEGATPITWSVADGSEHFPSETCDGGALVAPPTLPTTNSTSASAPVASFTIDHRKE